MNILILTVFGSVLLAVFFVICFLYERSRPDASALEQESLLPLDDAPPPKSPPSP